MGSIVVPVEPLVSIIREPLTKGGLYRGSNRATAFRERLETNGTILGPLNCIGAAFLLSTADESIES